MASEPDDNPFARDSVWPKMPQAPFRVGPLPKADAAPSGPAEPPPEPVRRTITPLFTRPLEAPPPTPNLAMGGAVPRAPARPAPAPPAAEVSTPVPAPAPAPAAAPVVEVAPEPPHELRELVVTPFATPRPKPRRRRSPLPAIAATLVGLGGLAGLIYLFTRPGPAPAPPATTVLAAPVTTMATPPPTVAEAAPAAPIVTAAAPPPASAPRAIRPVARSEPAVRVGRLPSDAARATEEAINAPVLTLPIAPPTPPPKPQPAFRPPAAADPNAPIRTQRPY